MPDPTDLTETAAAAAGRYAAELQRLEDGLRAHDIHPEPGQPVDTAPVTTALGAIDWLIEERTRLRNERTAEGTTLARRGEQLAREADRLGEWIGELREFPSTLLTGEQEIRALALDAAVTLTARWDWSIDQTEDMAAEILPLAERFASWVRGDHSATPTATVDGAEP